MTLISLPLLINLTFSNWGLYAISLASEPNDNVGKVRIADNKITKLIVVNFFIIVSQRLRYGCHKQVYGVLGGAIWPVRELPSLNHGLF